MGALDLIPSSIWPSDHHYVWTQSNIFREGEKVQQRLAGIWCQSQNEVLNPVPSSFPPHPLRIFSAPLVFPSVTPDSSHSNGSSWCLCLCFLHPALDVCSFSRCLPVIFIKAETIFISKVQSPASNIDFQEYSWAQCQECESQKERQNEQRS